MCIRRSTLIFILFTFVSLYGTRASSLLPEDANSPVTSTGKVIFGDDINFPPYSFLDENGQPTGFNIEIAKAAARAMGLEVEIRLDNWEDTRNALETGKIDAISGMFFSREREAKYKFTSRHSVSTGDIFTRKNRTINSLENLVGKRVVVQSGDIVGEFLKSLNLDITIIEVPTVTEALMLINNGIFEYAGIMKIPGQHAINESGLENVKAQGIQFLPMDYCIAVKQDNEDLYYILNAGLYILKTTDEYYRIHDKWLGVYEVKAAVNFFTEYRWIFLIIGIVIISLFAITLILRFMIRKKTYELRIVNNYLVNSNNEILKKNELLAQSKMELSERLEQIEKQDQIIKFKQNFLANMSHEIRTPLTGILGIIDLLGKTSLNKEQSDFINILRQSGENLTEIINQVLDFSKIEAGKVELNKKPFAFTELMTQATNLFYSLGGNRLKFHSSIDEKIPDFIVADKNRLIQIISNLISNGVKFTDSGSIEIHATIENEPLPANGILIKIAVSDTGPGILPEKQKHLFRPFAQIHESDQRGHEGTGLGLSICKELAMLHGGEIGLHSIPGSGSTFWFTFIAGTIEQQTLQRQNKIYNQISIPNLHILLAEDKIINRKVIMLLLTSLGHTVEIASNGEEAIQMFVPGKFDLILMDIQMPVMDGITATTMLREKHSSLPPIVGLSANAFEGDREKYISMGLDEYLTKPFKNEEFVEIVDRILKKTSIKPKFS
jgi:two-component system, OmpR family, aerobic respiration control sensor histidine kinase ArcB